MNALENLYEACDLLNKDLAEMNERTRNGGGKLNNDTVSYYDKLLHGIKSATTTIAMKEAEENESYGHGNGYSGRHPYGSYESSYDDGYESGMSNSRGRGKNAPRDRFGQYKSYESRDNYSRDDGKKEMMRTLNEMMQSAPNEQKRSDIANIMNKLEQM